MTLLFSP